MNRGIVFVGIGFELVSMCVGGFFIGQWIDREMGWRVAATTTLTLMLLVGWFIHLIVLLKRFESLDDDDSPDKGI